MKTNKTNQTNGSVLRENQLYPLHVSDRADELLGELSQEQVWRLYSELKTITYQEWMNWLEDEREVICKYDCLSSTKRRRRLLTPADTEALRLQHACVFVELWRARVHREFFPLPPNAAPIGTHLAQRDLMLNVVAAYSKQGIQDLWPFYHPDIDDPFPFLKET